MSDIAVLDAIVTPCYLGTNPWRFACIAFSIAGEDDKAIPVADAAQILRDIIPGTPVPTQPHFIQASHNVAVEIIFNRNEARFRAYTPKEDLLRGTAPVTEEEEQEFLETWRRNVETGILITLRDDFSFQDTEADFRLRTELFTALVRKARIEPSDDA